MAIKVNSKTSSKVRLKGRPFALICLALSFVLCFSLGLILGCSPEESAEENPWGDLPACDPDDLIVDPTIPIEPAYFNDYGHVTQVGCSYELLGTTARNKPVEGTSDGGSSLGYPKYGYTLSTASDATKRQEIITENVYLCGKHTTNTGGVYDWMDENGYLYIGTRSDYTQITEDTYPAFYAANHGQLYAHTGSVGMYYGNDIHTPSISDSQPAVIKRCTFRQRSYTSYYEMTGVYAAPGEVIKIELTPEDMNLTGGIIVHIGQALYNGQCNNIWNARALNRMPVILNTMYVTKDTAYLDETTGMWTAYVGSYIGGPVYIRDESVQYSVTISGGLEYPHFILGVTTEEEYARIRNYSTVPFFDLEVWDSGVLHSGPWLYAKAFSYDDLYKAAILWEKVSLVSTKRLNQGIVFLYDPFVAAGAAVAFPGRRSVNCPAGWMSSSLNYNSIVTSGAWGNFHEYHHNFQTFGGIGYTGEITNNALNLVSYSLFTKISSARQVSGYGGAGLSGWNCYTSATWDIERVNLGGGYITSTNALSVYGVLLHNFGQDAFLHTVGTNVGYLNAWATTTHQDFSYYASVLTATAGTTMTTTETNYPLFVPVASVYQTGRTYMYGNEKREITTMQPYVIPYGQPFTVDLRKYTNYYNDNGADTGQYHYGSVVIGKGFKFEIIGYDASGANGTFTETDIPGVYTFTPDSNILSGKIYVTIRISVDPDDTTFNASAWAGFEIDDVDLVLQFQQSHEWNKNILERTTYYYTAETKPTDAREAYESNYAGYYDLFSRDHSNPTQNSNTDIWYYPNTDANHSKYPDAPEYYFVNVNSVDEVRGKIYFPEDGTFRIYLRGRLNCALYLSVDGGKNYFCAAYIEDKNSSTATSTWRNDENTYYDVEIKEAGSWVYFKEVLINVQISTGQAGFIGLGLAQWTVPLYTTQTVIVEGEDENVQYYYLNGNNVKTHITDLSYIQEGMVYLNSSGNLVTPEEAENTKLIEPETSERVISYVTAYRQDYEFTKEFESEYYYQRDYKYSYTDKVTYSGKAELVSVTHGSWDTNQTIDKLLNGLTTGTAYHSQSGVHISEDKPFELVADLGQLITANHVTFYGYNSTYDNNGMPLAFTLYGSRDGVNFYELVSRNYDSPYTTKDVTFDFETATLRYYKLVVTKTTSKNQYFAMFAIIFYHHTISLYTGVDGDNNPSNIISLDSPVFSYYGEWELEATQSTFGSVLVGSKGSQMMFEFEGTNFLIWSSSQLGANYDVYIDGKLTSSADFLATNNLIERTYLSPNLDYGKHKVVIICQGEANIDCVSFYKSHSAPAPNL